MLAKSVSKGLALLSHQVSKIFLWKSKAGFYRFLKPAVEVNEEPLPLYTSRSFQGNEISFIKLGIDASVSKEAIFNNKTAYDAYLRLIPFFIETV